jgi:hypothetical protein
MLTILDAHQLTSQDMTVKDRLRLMKTRKRFAVFVDDKLHLVDDLERLFFDRLRSSNVYDAMVYQLR